MSIYRSLYKNNNDPKISLNFFELVLSTQDISLLVSKYLDEKKLKSIREENPDYFFYRDRDEIFAWKRRQDTSENIKFPNSSTRMINYLSKPYLFAKIIQIGIENFLKSVGLQFVGKKPFIPEFINLKNLCYKIPGIALYSKVSIETEVMSFAGHPKLGFLINYGLYTEFTDSVSKLIEQGVDPRGMFLKNTFGDVSKIIQIDNNTLILDNKTSVNASDVFPLANRKNQLRYLSSIGKTREFLDILDIENKPNKIYSKIQRAYEYLKTNKSNLFLGGIFDIQDIHNFAISGNSDGLKKDKLHRPIHYYRDNQPEKDKYPSKALSEQGPFIDPPKKLKVIVLSSDEYKGNVELFLKKLAERLKNLFHFEEVAIKDLYFSKAEPVLKGFYHLLYNSGIKANDYDVAVIIISEEYRQLPTERNPYYVVKSLLMGDRVPSQEVEIETIKQMRSTTETYILNNIALAIYGKIGYTPWAIERLDTIRKEFVIGIGSSVLKVDNNSISKIIGLATVFDFTGRYVVGECSTLATTEDYREVLKDSLISLISDLIERENIKPENEIRLIFHLFKPAGKRNEFWAIEKALNNFKKYSIEYAVLHLNRGHNFRIFANDGEKLPSRGLLIEISDNKKLLSFVSSSFHRRIRGNPTPILIILDQRSTFKDIDYLIKQVFYFSFLSCKSFIPSKTPITILYPSLLALLSRKLKEIPGWDYRKLDTVKDKLWFI